MWYICLSVSVAVFIISIIAAFASNKYKGKLIKPLQIMTVGVFAAVALLFVPIYTDAFNADGIVVKPIKIIFISMHHAIRLFIVDSDFDIIRGIADIKDGIFYELYSCYAALLYVISPILTFGIVLSFFKNISAYRKYIMSYNKDLYIFSEYNEKSLALAESVLEKCKNTSVIFTDVKAQQEIDNKHNAIYFYKDILSIDFKFHSKYKNIKFFMMSDDESKNIRQALEIIKNYKNTDRSWLYVFSNEIEGEALLSSIQSGYLKVRRVSDVRTLIFMLLQTKGELLFKEAVKIESLNKRLIEAVVVGAGKSGKEMIKALSWFGQMDGYRVEITAFDKKKDIKSRLSAECPELLDEEHNNQFDDDGEAQYKIDIKGNVDVETAEFFEEIKRIKNITYIFVDIGSDEQNIRISIKLRHFLKKYNMSPRIQAVVNDTERKNALEGIKNYSEQAFDIDYVGDVKSLYAVGSIIESDLEADALKRHLKWGKETDFWRYEYNYRSSLASALHRKMKIKCNVPGITKLPEERSENEKLVLRMMEHRRWNAYMRTEGYTYAENRNNIAKTHNCLVTYNKLSPKDKAKDDD